MKTRLFGSLWIMLFVTSRGWKAHLQIIYSCVWKLCFLQYDYLILECQMFSHIFYFYKYPQNFCLINFLSCSKWLQVGYIVTSCLLNENHDFLRLAINTVRNDIIGRNETFQCLALTMVCWQEIYRSLFFP